MEKAAKKDKPISQPVMDGERNQVAKVNLNPGVFDVPFRSHVVHSVVVMQETNHRRGTASTKNRGEVTGSGKKPWRQKGTGRARVGSRRSPLWVGGGVIFGPKPREFKSRVSKKVKKAALRMALSQKRREGRFLVLDDLKLDEIKTKKLKEILDRMDLESALLVVAGRDDRLELSARNIPGVKVLRAEGLNVRDVIMHDQLVFVREALAKVEEALA